MEPDGLGFNEKKSFSGLGVSIKWVNGFTIFGGLDRQRQRQEGTETDTDTGTDTDTEERSSFYGSGCIGWIYIVLFIYKERVIINNITV